MRTILVLLICSILLVFTNTSPEKRKITAKNISQKTNPIDFKTQVQPVLQKNCSPCHFPGGKLYEKLPFDKDITIVNHESGILKRLKKEDETTLIRRFTAQTKDAK